MYPSSIQKLIESFRSLPGVGEKTAERYALSVSEMEPEKVEQFALALFVVQSPKDVIAMEKAGEYRGVYHVLNGVISPSKGVMPEDLEIDKLVERAANCEEVILATSNTMDGETTAMYLDRLLREQCPDLLVTRIAHGLPAGGLLDYADEMTLAYALSNRRSMK